MADVYDYPPGDGKSKNSGLTGLSFRKWFAILALVVLYVVFRFFVTFKLDWTWFSVLGYDAVFWRSFTAKIMIGIGIFAVAFLFTYLNTYLIFKMTKKPFRPLISLIPALFIGILATGNGSYLWMAILKYFNAEPFGLTDPQFNLDIGFYVFKLPVLWLGYRVVNLLLMMNIIIAIPAYLYLLSGRMEVISQFITKRILTKEESRGFTHVGLLLGIFIAWQAVQYKLSSYELLYSQTGSVVGAGATDIGARLPGYSIMMVISLVLGVFIFLTIRKNIKRSLLSIAAYFIIATLITGVYPGIYQKFIVDPDELGKETPYLEKNIKYTHQAFGLDNLTEVEYPVDELTMDEIENERDIIDNIRLLDHRATKSTYGQQHEIRLYYDFTDVDIDRYTVDGKLTQVLLSARELNRKSLPEQAKTFNNLMFKYTHGFGLAMSPANAISDTGLPQYLIKDIPPQSELFPVKEPRIYFGEATGDNVIVNTGLKEFDYPLGDNNQEYIYQGNKGIPMTFGNKFLLTLRDAQFKYLLSNYITSESQYLETRNVVDRVSRIAPFLYYDHDPYLVLGEDGNLYYLLDAYTFTDKYPYSQALNEKNSFNYMRNSVKVVLNAYSGEADFYIFDDDDPIIKVYSKIYPDLFKGVDEFPSDLKKHVRYPEDLFAIQSIILRDYHMSNPTVFYNREDRWELSQEVYWGELQTQEPFYSIISLPNEEKKEFILMQTFTPAKKQNMVGWLAGRSDGDDYGKLLLYKFPKGVQIAGTAQVESLIDQDPVISSQLTLWGQGGSRILRGNLLVYPIGGSLLYVEPLYIEAEQTKYPQLKKVFLYYNNKIVMEDTLEKALISLFGDGAGKEESSQIGGTDIISGGVNDSVESLIKQLVELQKQGKEEIKAGDWAGYGEVQKEMEDLISILEGKM